VGLNGRENQKNVNVFKGCHRGGREGKQQKKKKRKKVVIPVGDKWQKEKGDNGVWARND